MKNLRKFLAGTALLLVASLVLSCASAPKQKATLEKTHERMFWTISGVDSKGNPSKVYVLGTIHMADERVFPLADSVVGAFDGAGRIVAELGLEDLQKNLMAKIVPLMLQDLLPGGKTVLDDLSESQGGLLVEMLGEKSEQLVRFNPWVSSLTCQNSFYEQFGFDPKYGIDNNLYSYAMQGGRDVEGLDTVDTQIEIIRFGDYGTQLTILRDLLDQLGEKEEVQEYMKNLYEAYLNDDIESLAALQAEEMSSDERRNEIYKEYNCKLYANRNSVWAEKIAGYLADGGETFIFAGCAHFTVGKTVFDYMRANGTLN